MTEYLFGHFVLFGNKSFVTDVKYVPNSTGFFPTGFSAVVSNQHAADGSFNLVN